MTPKNHHIILFFLLITSCSIPSLKDSNLSDDQILADWEIIVDNLLKDNLDTAISLSKALLEKSEETDNFFGRVKANMALGIMLKKQEVLDESIQYYLEGMRQAETDHYDSIFMDKIWMRRVLANTFRTHEANELATRYNLEAIQIAKAHGVFKQVVDIKYNQGLVYQSDGQYDLSIAFFQDVIRLSDSISYKSEDYYYRVLNQIGCVYLENGEYDSAKVFFNQLLDIKDPTYIFYKAQALHNIGEVNHDNGKILKTIDLLRQAISIFKRIENVNKRNLFFSYRNLGSYLFQTNQIEEAISVLSKAESMIPDADWGPSSFKVYKSFSDLYYSIGEEELGNVYLKLYNNEMETYHGANKENLELVASRYFERIEKEEKEERIATIVFYIKLIGGSVLGIFALLLGYNRVRRVRLQSRQDTLTRDKMVSDLKALKAQINPHFLFNSLNSIQSFVLEGEDEQADDYLVKYGKLMRMILDHSNELTIYINEEIAALKLYVALEQVRLGKELTFNVIVADEIDPDSIMIPSMVIQPVLENAIWHGIQPKEGAGELQLEITQKDHWISVIITDNGVGFDIGKEEGNKPHGLQLVQERIDILNQVNGVKSTFHVTSSPQGTRIEFSYPKDLGLT